MKYFNDVSANKYKIYIDIGLGIIVLYGVLFNYIQLINSITNNYLPVLSDEFFYFINTNSFVQNGILEAALTCNGEGSRIFGADPHGFGYSLLHGGIAKVFGWSNLNFIYFNFISVLISILLIWLIKSITIAQKLWISNIILMFPFFLLYGFTYMQESIHVFFALIISVLVYCIYNKDDKKVYIGLFILTIFIAGIFRALWFFWLIGLIPLAKSNKQLIAYLSLFLFGIVSSFVFVRFFIEPIPNYFSSIITLLKDDKIGEGIISLFNHFYENIYLYFFGKRGDLVYKSMKYINFGIVAYFSYMAIKNKSRLTTAIALIGLSNFFLLFFFYDAFDWREIRTMSPLFYFSIIFIVTSIRRNVTYLFAIVLCFLFFSTFKISNQWIDQRNSMQVLNGKKNAYKEIAQKIGNNKLVLLDYIPRDYSTDLLDLPLRNINGSPIRYIIPYYDVEKKHHDYTILKPNTNTQNFKIIENEYYTFVENKLQKNEELETEGDLPKNLSVDQYVKLSLLYYEKKDYFKSIEASKKVISLDSNSNIAYNNLCSSYNALLMYDEAKIACEKSLLIKPKTSLTINNLGISNTGIDRRKNQKFTLKEYLNLSHNYYQLGYFDRCIEVSKELLEVEPNSVVAYNNICSSYIALGNYEKAIEACKKALEINPDYQLAKNNLKWAKSKLTP